MQVYSLWNTHLDNKALELPYKEDSFSTKDLCIESHMKVFPRVY